VNPSQTTSSGPYIRNSAESGHQAGVE